MNTNKVLMGGLAGGVAFFFLGWIIYGMLLMDYMMAYSNHCDMKPEADFVWWAMIISCLLTGLFYAIIFDWSNIRTAMAGAKAGAILGSIMCLSMDLGYYAMSTKYSNVTVIIVNMLACAVMTAIGGALIGWIMGRTPGPAAPTPATV